jgi:hypothetical protein
MYNAAKFILQVYDSPVNFWFRLPLRTRLGVIGCVFLISVIVVLMSWYHDPDHFSYRNAWILRLGPLIFLLWLAWSDLEQIPWWNWLIMLVILIVCAIKPGAWFAGVPIICYILFAQRKK